MRTVFLFLLSLAIPLSAQVRYTKVEIPDIPGYKTLKCDFHMHTIYSDGSVTPDVRVLEAVSEGLDAIALSDHIYGEPKKDKEVVGDHNTAYKKAKGYADMLNLLLIKGVEISRGMPPGHINAIFIKDANKLETPDFMDACKEAKQQGGFIFWNHPGWWRHQPDVTRWFDEHTRMLQQGLLQGIEIVNTRDYFPEGHQWCLEKNLTMIGNSDSHLPTGLYYDFGKGEHRPMTLVFAKERSVESIREALLAGRTVVYHGDILIGREEYLKALFEASVEVVAAKEGTDGVSFMIRNNSQIPFLLKKKDDPSLECERELLLSPKSVYMTGVKIKKKDTPVVLRFVVENLYVKPDQGMEYELTIKK